MIEQGLDTLVLDLEIANQSVLVTERRIGSWSQWPGVAAGQHYPVAINVHCHKLVPIVI